VNRLGIVLPVCTSAPPIPIGLKVLRNTYIGKEAIFLKGFLSFPSVR
jgi:hypothetical protein